jgi:hypothetical protein
MNKTIALAVLALSLAGCAGLIQKSGDLLDGNGRGTKTLGSYRYDGGKHGRIDLRLRAPKDGEAGIEITGSPWPGLALWGTLPDQEGNFALTSLRFLSSHVHGWNEFTLDLLGSAAFEAAGDTAVLRVPAPVERVQISSGKLRLKSSRLAGTAALAPLRNRRERILALIEWMDAQMARQDGVMFVNQQGFEEYWKPRLLPELAAAKKRPPEYTRENAEWVRADGIKWNRTYTELLFPPELWELRNSGALLRDWEEALAWIYLEYSWNMIIASLDGTVLRRR